MFSHIAQSFIHRFGRPLQSTHPRVHGRIPPFSRLNSAACVPVLWKHTATTPSPALTSNRGSSRGKPISPLRSARSLRRLLSVSLRNAATTRSSSITIERNVHRRLLESLLLSGQRSFAGQRQRL